MAKRKKHREPENWIENDLPVIGELKDCRQLNDDHWQGTDVDGTIIDVRGGRMPKYLVVRTRRFLSFRNGGGLADCGIIRLVPAAHCAN